MRVALIVAFLAAAPLPGAAASSVPCGRDYVVQRGDYLAEIARRAYGPEANWTEVWRANRDRVSRRDASALEVGMRLRIPCRDAPARVVEPAGPPDWLAAPLAGLGWAQAALERLDPALLAGLAPPMAAPSCGDGACAGRVWSRPLREAVVIRFAARETAQAPLCRSAALAALGLAGAAVALPDAASCLDAVARGEMAAGEALDAEIEALDGAVPASLKAVERRLAPLSLSLPQDAPRAAARIVSIDAALAAANAARWPSPQQ